MTTWVLLRGLMRDSRHWGDFPERLRDVVGLTPVITLDLPGNGSLNHLRSPASIETMATWCRSELAARGHPPPYSILAMSLGAMVATAWLMEAPQEVDACVLINTSMRPSPFFRRLHPQNYGTLLRLALLGGSDAAWETGIYRLTSNHPDRAAQILPVWTRWRHEHPITRANALRQLLAAGRFSLPSEKPRPPVLVLASTHDQLVDVRCSRELAARWDVPLVEHPTAGHDIPMDDGDWVARQVADWLKRRRPASADFM